MRSDMPPGFGPNDPTAGDQAENDYCDATFSVHEYPPERSARVAPLNIWIETREPGLRILRAGDASIRLDCRAGVTMEEATRLADEMNRLLCGVASLKFTT